MSPEQIPLTNNMRLPSLSASICAWSGYCHAHELTTTAPSLSWYPPASYFVNNLSQAINTTGTYGFIFDASDGPLDTYNWCNMPHTNIHTYPKASPEFTLEYVEVIHRHHKRTPYADNTFPIETDSWDCTDEALFYAAQPFPPLPSDAAAASTYWSVYTSPSNPFAPTGFNGTCQFPQITRQGLRDSHQHGKDLKSVYSDLLDFIPATYDPAVVSYRVTNNVITSQVASMLIAGMYPAQAGTVTPLLIQPASIDSLEPKYPCAAATSVFSSYGPGSSSPPWTHHLHVSAPLFSRLDALSGVPPNSSAWHQSWDHYFDNLSARLCHAKALPCRPTSSPAHDCVTRRDADTVFRLGQYEYSFLYRDAPQSLPYSAASYGVWVAELAVHLRQATAGRGRGIRYRHNVAHDGSVARVLSILQVDRMVWPGMGAEVVFELYRKRESFYLRVLWGGQVLQSSHPDFRFMDMIPVDVFLAYLGGLVGQGAARVPGMCVHASEEGGMSRQ
jgi:acid phosphatase